MGYTVPPMILVPPTWRADPSLWPKAYVDDLLHRMRYRRSWFPTRRRAAYVALLQVIRWREAILWPPPEPVPAPPPMPRACSPVELVSGTGVLGTFCECGHPTLRHYNDGCNDCDRDALLGS